MPDNEKLDDLLEVITEDLGDAGQGKSEDLAGDEGKGEELEVDETGGKDEDVEEGVGEEGEGEGDEEDEEEGESYTEDDLRKLTSFPKELRPHIAKLPKEAQSQLIGWLQNQNKEKVAIQLEAKRATEVANKEFESAKAIRKEIVDGLTKLGEEVKKKGFKPEVVHQAFAGVIETVKKLNVEFFNAYREKAYADIADMLDAAIRETGAKPKAWAEKNPLRFHAAAMALMFCPPAKRDKVLKTVVKGRLLRDFPDGSAKGRPSKSPGERPGSDIDVVTKTIDQLLSPRRKE